MLIGLGLLLIGGWVLELRRQRNGETVVSVIIFSVVTWVDPSPLFPSGVQLDQKA